MLCCFRRATWAIYVRFAFLEFVFTPIADTRITSKWFLSTIGHDGLNNLISAYTDKSADAVCTFAFSKGRGQAPVLFQGRCKVIATLADKFDLSAG